MQRASSGYILALSLCASLAATLQLGCSAGPSTSGGAAGASSSGGASSQFSPAHDCGDGSTACAAHATCVPDGASHRCVCDDGYTGDGVANCSAGLQARDCSNGGMICPEHATCVPGGTGYRCACDDGYTGDGLTTCNPLDPTACATCSVDGAACPGGGTCRARPCDGHLACYAAAAGSACNTVAGKLCPKTPLFGSCSTCDECGSEAICYHGICSLPNCGAPNSGQLQCPRLSVQGLQVGCQPDLYSPPCPGYPGPPDCMRLSGTSLCGLACDASSKCPPLMYCFKGWCKGTEAACEVTAS